jgi:hypothetical protein
MNSANFLKTSHRRISVNFGKFGRFFKPWSKLRRGIGDVSCCVETVRVGGRGDGPMAGPDQVPALQLRGLVGAMEV